MLGDLLFMNYFTHPAEKWTKEQCEKAVKRIARDGLGTPYSFKGAHPEIKGKGEYEQGYSHQIAAEVNTGTIRYNGGKIINGEWYEGEIFQLPILPAGFKWVYRLSWCWRIIKI